MNSLLELLLGALLVFIIVAGSIAVSIYSREARRRRVQWRASLYERFSDDPRFRRMRLLLDSRSKEFDELRGVVESGAANERTEELVDYLSFIEFIAVLWRQEQVERADIQLLFDYDLKNLRSSWIVEFIRSKGFRSLDILLAAYDQQAMPESGGESEDEARS